MLGLIKACIGVQAPMHLIQPSTSSQALINKAQMVLMEQLNKHPYTKLLVKPKIKQATSSISLSHLKVQIKDRYPPLKQICVRLTDNKHSIPIWFKIKAYQQVLVAKHTIRNRTIINSNDFILENKNVAGLNSSPYQQLPLQTWVKKSLSKGTILTEEYLSNRPDIVNGQSVQVHIKSQGVLINTEAIAQHDAYLGQVIKIKNMRSNKFFMAVVTAPDHVEVHA
jgi:flagella basal body P-ring formation protein FlgA